MPGCARLKVRLQRKNHIAHGVHRLGADELQISVYTCTSPPHTHQPGSLPPRFKTISHDKTRLQKSRFSRVCVDPDHPLDGMHVPGTTPTRYSDYPHRAMPQRNPWAKVGPTLLPAHARNVSHHTKTQTHARHQPQRDGPPKHRSGHVLTCSPLAHCAARQGVRFIRTKQKQKKNCPVDRSSPIVRAPLGSESNRPCLDRQPKPARSSGSTPASPGASIRPQPGWHVAV